MERGLGRLTSEVLFKRLTHKEMETEKEEQRLASENDLNRTSSSQYGGQSFQEWVRRKDAEKRLKRRLIQDSKNEIRAQLLDVAKDEQT